jgi:hypothetical protein
MTTELLAGSTASTAKIIQFPARGRFVPNSEPATSEIVSAAAFDSWYHDVAIKEAKRASER